MSLPAEHITYITRDIERAIGMDPSPSYRIIANHTPYAETIAARFPGYVDLIKSSETLGTRELIEHAAANKLISPGSKVLVFKNTARVEEAATQAGISLINPRATLGETIENKISQVSWLGDLARYLPVHAVLPTRKITWTGEPFILQWAHGHTGGGTQSIDSEQALQDIQARFPYRLARRSALVRGPSFTVNAVVAADKVVIGTPSYQITGIAPFTDSRFATIGNDWSIAGTMLSPADHERIREIAEHVGTKLNISGWRGLYGIDVMRDADGSIYLIEINARQPASVSFESSLQRSQRQAGTSGMITFEAHLASLLGQPLDGELIPITAGSQIVQRVTGNMRTPSESALSTLSSMGCSIATYPNTELHEDLIRIQTEHGIMRDHELFGELGERIARALSSS